jgi:hypothetical protein
MREELKRKSIIKSRRECPGRGWWWREEAIKPPAG